jgi:hypothetical protein
MANEGMPINKELIAWARKRAGLTQDEATLGKGPCWVQLGFTLLTSP